jgi:uncharacterized protein DUF6210
VRQFGFYPDFHLPVLVIEAPTGVRFSFQVGGSAHWRKSVQGLIYPVAATGFGKADKLGERLHSIAFELVALSDQEADEIDALFKGDTAIDLKVDRGKMSESCDGWVPMRVVRASDWRMQGFDLPLGCVLTW